MNTLKVLLYSVVVNKYLHEKLDILSPGTTIIVKAEEPFEAVIENIGITGRDLSIFYDVSWWQGRERKTLTIREDEIDVVPKTPVIKIGFSK